MIKNICILFFVLILNILSGCTSVPSREEVISNYNVSVHSNDSVSIQVSTGSVTYDSNFPKLGYRHLEQMQFAEDLTRILKNNNVFSDITLLLKPDTPFKSDYLIDLQFHSTEHCCDNWYYIIDFSIVITSKQGMVLYKTRKKFKSNSSDEVLNYTESFANALVAAKYIANNKLLKISVEGIEEWLYRLQLKNIEEMSI